MKTYIFAEWDKFYLAECECIEDFINYIESDFFKEYGAFKRFEMVAYLSEAVIESKDDKLCMLTALLMGESQKSIGIGYVGEKAVQIKQGLNPLDTYRDELYNALKKNWGI